ncbi:TKL protein kinase, variant 1 [Saprolegnia diclina VS20]|uniref:TKL protein kinase, variant 1 n=1 Tax=Saprolegnia diclina (strain VS20) TaxID=1156394 RepID=T0QUF7_SAPDV|nr:TKL protein kinase, variant 1 [Saprolegnia diclina VS20]EQC37650.1 TKL protein kinase, variant 1 [Saprolegnia diclina VS20]|eukprot:XP_008609171.1 TKL protein kinase, variant 1 [Saprolegnia diclina VS20]
MRASLVLALAQYAIGMVSAGASLYASCPRNTPSSQPCVISGNETGTMLLTVNYNTLLASGLLISDVVSLPPSATDVDLSVNQIADLSALRTPALTTLNVSNNKLGSLATLRYLAGLRTLDLSANLVSSLAFVTSFGNLTTLSPSGLLCCTNFLTRSLRNNLITSINNPTFPASLVSLDLSGNPISTFDVTLETYTQLSALPHLVLDATPKPTNVCFGIAKLLQNQAVVCVTDSLSTDNGSSGVPPGSLYSKIILIFGGFAFLAVLYMYLLKRLFNRPNMRDSIVTCASSAYSMMEDLPTEYCPPLAGDASVTCPLRSPDVARFKLEHAHIKKLRLQATIDGQVLYLGAHVQTKVCIKVAADTAAVTATVREVVLLSALEHEHIVHLVGFVASPRLVEMAIVLEYTQLGSLERVLARSAPLDSLVKLRIVKDVATAVAYLHQHDPPIVHNALTPPYILLAANWDVKLSGFAFGHRVGASPVLQSVHDDVAPEVQYGAQATPASDVYQLGRLMHRLELDVPALIAACTASDPTRRIDASAVEHRLQELLPEAVRIADE